jgi:hypothetical protein
MITELVRERLALDDQAPHDQAPHDPAPDGALGAMGRPSHSCPADCCGGSR